MLTLRTAVLDAFDDFFDRVLRLGFLDVRHRYSLMIPATPAAPNDGPVHHQVGCWGTRMDRLGCVRFAQDYRRLVGLRGELYKRRGCADGIARGIFRTCVLLDEVGQASSGPSASWLWVQHFPPFPRAHAFLSASPMPVSRLPRQRVHLPRTRRRRGRKKKRQSAGVDGDGVVRSRAGGLFGRLLSEPSHHQPAEPSWIERCSVRAGAGSWCIHNVMCGNSSIAARIQVAQGKGATSIFACTRRRPCTITGESVFSLSAASMMARHSVFQIC